jgi:hypothetical protein
MCLAPVIREEHSLFSKADSVDGLYVIFEMLQMFEDQPLRLAHGVATTVIWTEIVEKHSAEAKVLHTF